MAVVTRSPADENNREGFYVTTESGGKEYRYHLLVSDGRTPDAETEDEQMGTVRCVERRVTEDGDVRLLEPDVTDAVEDAMADHGFEVVD